MPRSRSRDTGPDRATKPNRYAALTGAKSSGGATFAQAPQGAVGSAVDAVLSEGDAVMFSRTSDGGAIAVLVLSGDERIRRYAVDQEQLDQLLTALELL